MTAEKRQWPDVLLPPADRKPKIQVGRHAFGATIRVMALNDKGRSAVWARFILSVTGNYRESPAKWSADKDLQCKWTEFVGEEKWDWLMDIAHNKRGGEDVEAEIRAWHGHPSYLKVEWVDNL